MSTDEHELIQTARARLPETYALAERHMNHKLVRMLGLIGHDTIYSRAQGCYVFDDKGKRYLDLHTGEGFESLGHNHPDVKAALKQALDADLYDSVQLNYGIWSGLLAEAILARTPSSLDKIFFTNSGAEAVEAALKFARAATGKTRFITCESAFHGLTYGALSICGDPEFQDGFGPLLPGVAKIRFNDLNQLEAELKKGDVAAFIAEPVQGRTVALPLPGYLKGAQELCRKHGALFILDEIQTGLGRTGRFFALEHWGLEPDFLLMSKAITGGYAPLGAMVTRREVFERVYSRLDRSFVHHSTSARNTLSMVAGLATLGVISKEGLVENADRVGQMLISRLDALRPKYELLKDVRGLGLMIGIELGPPKSLRLKAGWRIIHGLSEGLFAQLLVVPLHRDHGIIAMVSGMNDVIKLLPPLILGEAEVDLVVDALEAVLEQCHEPAGPAWELVRGIGMNAIRSGGLRAESPVVGLRSVPLAADPVPENLCLVTGASGFIGKALVRRLVQEGLPVRCLVRETSRVDELRALPVSLSVGDLLDRDSLRRAAAGCRYVFHAAAMVTDWEVAQKIRKVNAEGTRNLLDAATGSGVERFIHFSTTDVYGYPGGPKISEGHSFSSEFRNWYSQTKIEAELAVFRAHTEDALPVVVFRPGTVYGPGSLMLVGELANAVRSRGMFLIDRGKAVAGLCYIDNLMDAVITSFRREDVIGEAFNITDGSQVTWKEFFDGLARGLGAPPVERSIPFGLALAAGRGLEGGYSLARRLVGFSARPLLSRQAVHVMGTHQDFSIDKARKVFDYAPAVPFEEGMQRTVAWLKESRLTKR